MQEAAGANVRRARRGRRQAARQVQPASAAPAPAQSLSSQKHYRAATEVDTAIYELLQARNNPAIRRTTAHRLGEQHRLLLPGLSGSDYPLRHQVQKEILIQQYEAIARPWSMDTDGFRSKERIREKNRYCICLTYLTSNS